MMHHKSLIVIFIARHLALLIELSYPIEWNLYYTLGDQTGSVRTQ